MKEFQGGIFTGERAMFQAEGAIFRDCVFEDGESPLKHCRNLKLFGDKFRWKYPIWYSKDILVSGCEFNEAARAGIWYTENISISDTIYAAPKGLRRCSGVSLSNVGFPNAAETLWQCKGVKMEKVTAKGDYFGMNCEDMEIEGFELDGNYCFDGAKNITLCNCRLISKDSFWNSENITAENCYISGEYLGWNSSSLTLINCTIESLQGLCFVDGLKMVNCRTINTTLAFEYSVVDVDICGRIGSVKNPSAGRIRAEGIDELIMESDKIDAGRTVIEVAPRKCDAPL